MKKIFFSICLLSLVPFSLQAADRTATVKVSYDGTSVYAGSVTLSEDTTTALTDSSGTTHNISSIRALSGLKHADDASDAFSISELIYYSSFNALYLKCINVPSHGGSSCNEWMYTVNGQSPPLGMDSYDLSNGDVLEVYFRNAEVVAPAPAPKEGGWEPPVVFEIIEYMAPFAPPLEENIEVTAEEDTDTSVGTEEKLETIATPQETVAAPPETEATPQEAEALVIEADKIVIEFDMTKEELTERYLAALEVERLFEFYVAQNTPAEESVSEMALKQETEAAIAATSQTASVAGANLTPWKKIKSLFSDVFGSTE